MRTASSRSLGMGRFRRLYLLPGLALVTALLPATSVLAAQEQEAQPAETSEGTEQGAAADSTGGEDLDELLGAPSAQDTAGTGEDLDLIEDLLAEGDDALQTSFVYDGGGRRDPFRSLLVVADQTAGPQGPRPEGVPGLLIDEITVSGVWITPQGPVAQVQSADQAVSYLLKEGDRLYDGDVISISHSREGGSEIRFRQIVDDPTAPKPFRDVVRKLEP